MTKNNRLLLFAIVLTACNLRACLTGIGPLSAMIQACLLYTSRLDTSFYRIFWKIHTRTYPEYE